MDATNTNLFWTLVGPLGSFAVLLGGWRILKNLTKRYEQLEDMHGVFATVLVTFAIFVGYAARGEGALFVESPEMLIVVGAVSLEVIYDRIAFFFVRDNSNASSDRCVSLLIVAIGIFLCAAFIVDGHIAHEVAKLTKAPAEIDVSSKPDSYTTTFLWLAAFGVAIANKWVQGSLKIEAKEQENAQLIEAQKQECAQLIEAQKQENAQ